MKTCHDRLLWISFVLSLLIADSSAWAGEQRKIVPQAKVPAANPGVETGRYYAIVIGINEYQHLPKLQTAKKDAEDVARLLREKFGFEVRLLLDATRHEIVDSINRARALLRENDNFLIYYAGHGEFDKATEKGFWLPADARPDSDAEWIIADTITSNIKRFTARHILIVADSCYSGTMTRKAVTSLAFSEERAIHLRKMLRKTSRTLMASGGNEPVADSGGEGHSIFASVFLRALDRMEEPAFTAERLFDDEIKVAVSGRAEQTPEYHDIRNSGHDGGDFVFVARSARPEPPGGGGDGLKEERKKLEAERAQIEEERKKLEEAKRLAEERRRVEEERRKLAEEREKLARLEPPKTEPGPQTSGQCPPKMASIPAGRLASENISGEMPVGGFCMDKYETTQAEYEKVMGRNPSHFKGGNLPMEQVTWYEADTYCNKVGKRLPTEWEWEYAARGGTATTYHWGDSEAGIEGYAWFMGNSENKTHAVGEKKPNQYGLYDMAGNVWEWTASDYDNSGKKKVLRSGAWNNTPYASRAAFRDSFDLGSRDSLVGFRCAQ
ncbi:MAG: SUMF1/EgtB/PvdO family nonheme iron enzyme [Nitrospinae bacterium]|nr:SUMF1/EgtB/PvdO family nonheme iron enzyme [Nitrospinota bacterium]